MKVKGVVGEIVALKGNCVRQHKNKSIFLHKGKIFIIKVSTKHDLTIEDEEGQMFWAFRNELTTANPNHYKVKNFITKIIAKRI